MFATKVLSFVVASLGLWYQGPSISGFGDVAERALHLWATAPDTDDARRGSRPAIRDEELLLDDVEGTEVSEPAGQIMPFCPAELGQQLPLFERRVVEMAYSELGWLRCLGGYVAAAHAFWCWWCCSYGG